MVVLYPWPEVGAPVGFEMNCRSYCRSWSNLAIALLVAGMAPLTVATDLGRGDDAWPTLLSREQPSNLRIAMLQYRANATLERLVQSAPVSE
jgi:hypothetical protein